MNNIKLMWKKAAVMLVIAVSLSSQATVFANSDKAYNFKAPLGIAGSGCVARSVLLDPDNPVLKFKMYQADSKEKQRVSCSLALPVEVARGYQIAVKQVRYFGNVSMGAGLFKYKTFFAGSPDIEFVEHRLTASDDAEYCKVDKVDDPLWSACGRSVNLRFNTALQVAEQASEVRLTGLGFVLMQRTCQ